MVNIGAIWGTGLGLLFLLAIYLFIRKKIKKEVKVIDVKRPEEDTGVGTATPIVEPTESGTDRRVDGKGSKRKSKKQKRVQTKSVETTKPIEQRDKQHSTATPPPEPFKY